MFSIEDRWACSEVGKHTRCHRVHHEGMVLRESKWVSNSHERRRSFGRRRGRCGLSPMMVGMSRRRSHDIRLSTAVCFIIILDLCFGLWEIEWYFLSGWICPQRWRTRLRTWLSHAWWCLWRYLIWWWCCQRWYRTSLRIYGYWRRTFGRHVGRGHWRWNCKKYTKNNLNYLLLTEQMQNSKMYLVFS